MAETKNFSQKQTQQVIENMGEVSGIGQNNPNSGHFVPAGVIGRSRVVTRLDLRIGDSKPY
jgi:hypothetical protein